MGKDKGWVQEGIYSKSMGTNIYRIGKIIRIITQIRNR